MISIAPQLQLDSNTSNSNFPSSNTSNTTAHHLIYSNFGPLIGVPFELLDDKLDSMKPKENHWTANSKFILKALYFNSLTARDLWKLLIPERPSLMMFTSPSTQTQDCNAYDWIISSLEKWFSNAPFDHATYLEWSMSTIIDVLQGEDVGSKASQFRIASDIVKNQLLVLPKQDMLLLQKHFNGSYQ